MSNKNAVATVNNSPYALIQSAVAGNASVDTLERLLALQERWEAGEAKKAFIAAMQQFQAIKPALPRTNSVSFGSGKTAYNFCPLPVIESALRDPLAECGLSFRFENVNKDGAFGVRCIVTHSAGHSEYTEMFAPADDSGNKNKIQAIGSTSTYLMRYTLIAAFALTTADEDDDGQSNSDLPLGLLLRHNEVLRGNLKVVLNIKDAIADKDFYQVAAVMDALAEDVKTALWMAPSKGGIFTTAEIASFKSNEYASAKADYYAEKQTTVV